MQGSIQTPSARALALANQLDVPPDFWTTSATLQELSAGPCKAAALFGGDAAPR
jgi:hypothetical protein